MRFIIKESEKNTIRQMYGLVTESINVGGRSTSINSDGTVSINDVNGKPQKIRMSLSIGGDINIKNIQPTNGGYNITGGRMTQFVDNNKISQVIQFVDTNSPSEIDSDSWSTPNLILTKV